MLVIPERLQKEFIYKKIDELLIKEIYANDCVQYYGDNPKAINLKLKPIYKPYIKNLIKHYNAVNSHGEKWVESVLFFILLNISVKPEDVYQSAFNDDMFCVSIGLRVMDDLNYYFLDNFNFHTMILNEDFEEELVYTSKYHEDLWIELGGSFLTFCQEVDPQKYINILLTKYKHKVNKNPKKRIKQNLSIIEN